MKKLYLSTAVVLSAFTSGLIAGTVTSAVTTTAASAGTTAGDGATAATTTTSPATTSGTPTATTAPTVASEQSSQKSLRKIFLLGIKDAQGALDDATGFVAISPAKRTICFSEQGGVWKGGYIVTPAMQLGLPGATCQTINPTGGAGQQITDVNAIKIPVATQHFDWKPGSQTNPDEWYTPSTQMPADNVYGVCTTSDSGDIGLAIRGVGKPHQCVLTNRSVPLNDQSILVLVK